jgi:quinol monooxygenase YgiN
MDSATEISGDAPMTAFNAVRFRVKPGREQEFLDAHRNIQSKWIGLKRADMIRTGDRSYCLIGEWEDIAAVAAARPNMIATLNSFRDTLEDLGGDLGLTDPVSGPVVLEIR